MNYRDNDSGLQIFEIELTNRCNLSCKHCYVKKDRFADLPQDFVKGLIDQSSELGVNRIVFSGGEPLLYNGLFGLAQYAKEIGVPETALLTNGLLINEKNIDRLRTFDIIQLSIDVPPTKPGVMRIDYANALEKRIDLLKSSGLNACPFRHALKDSPAHDRGDHRLRKGKGNEGIVQPPFADHAKPEAGMPVAFRAQGGAKEDL